MNIFWPEFALLLRLQQECKNVKSIAHFTRTLTIFTLKIQKPVSVDQGDVWLKKYL